MTPPAKNNKEWPGASDYSTVSLSTAPFTRSEHFQALPKDLVLQPVGAEAVVAELTAGLSHPHPPIPGEEHHR